MPSGHGGRFAPRRHLGPSIRPPSLGMGYLIEVGRMTLAYLLPTAPGVRLAVRAGELVSAKLSRRRGHRGRMGRYGLWAVSLALRATIESPDASNLKAPRYAIARTFRTPQTRYSTNGSWSRSYLAPKRTGRPRSKSGDPSLALAAALWWGTSSPIQLDPRRCSSRHRSRHACAWRSRAISTRTSPSSSASWCSPPSLDARGANRCGRSPWSTR